MSKNIFNSVPVSIPKRNHFDLTHDVKLSLRMGQLVPICAIECMPSDTMTISAEMLIKFAPLVAPVMHRFDATIHYFFVPNRILWANWERFITGSEKYVPGSPVIVNHPYVTYDFNTDVSNQRLLDYFGLPFAPTATTPAALKVINALPLAAYQMIYNEYYRDQNLIDSVYGEAEGPTGDQFPLSDGDNTTSDFLFALRLRAWEHDYFTGCLPFAQKGDPVSLPVALQDAPVFTSSSPAGVGVTWNGLIGGGAAVIGSTTGTPIGTGPTVGPEELYADMSNVGVTTTIEDFRRALKLQEWLEKSARVGSRYVEQLGGFWGVRPQDSRLDRPEYITGVKMPIVISEVLNTAGLDTGDPETSLPQGNMSGHGVGVLSGQPKSYFCSEHGWIIGILSVRPKTSYQQGIHKKWMRGTVYGTDRYDYPWPQFANIGEQDVDLQEVYVQAGDTLGSVFGYVPRYAEYKYSNNLVVGEFRTSLSYWTCSRIFGSVPGLNQDFIECQPRTDIFAVTDDVDNLYAVVLNKIHALRPLPKFGVPKI